MPQVSTVWNCWENNEIILDFPSDWKVTEYTLPNAPRIEPNQIREKITDYFTSAKLLPLIQEINSICIVLDDITRPVCWKHVLHTLIDIIQNENRSVSVSLLIANGCHKIMTQIEIEKKLGKDISRAFLIHQHDAIKSEFAWTTINKNSYGINHIFLHADLKIVLSTVLPHSFAGFSGGAKGIFPGLGDIESIKRNHARKLFSTITPGDTKNVIRQEIDLFGPLDDHVIGIAVGINKNREIATLEVGNLEKSYNSCLCWSKEYYKLPVNEGHNILVLNSYPKDYDLFQIENVMNIVKRVINPSTLELIIVLAFCNDGLGHHNLFAQNGPLYRKPKRSKLLQNTTVLYLSPILTKNEFYTLYPDDYILFSSSQNLLKYAQSLNLKRYNVGFIHTASICY